MNLFDAIATLLVRWAAAAWVVVCVLLVAVLVVGMLGPVGFIVPVVAVAAWWAKQLNDRDAGKKRGYTRKRPRTV